MKLMYREFDKADLIDSSRFTCAKWIESTCFLDTWWAVVLGRDKNHIFLVISRPLLFMETASLLVHIWTIISLVQCTDTISADTPVNVSGLISLLSQMKVFNNKKRKQIKKTKKKNSVLQPIKKTILKKKLHWRAK